MQTRITVREFCEKYLEPNETIIISDFDTDHEYFVGEVHDILKDPTNKAYNVLIVKLSVSYDLKRRTAFNFEV